MLLILTRVELTDGGLYGKLETKGFACVTLERHDISIPTGKYPITIYDSPKHGRIPLLLNVPGRSMIEIHEGNYERQSRGCILVGKNRLDIDGDGRDDITASKDTLKQLVQIVAASPDQVYISII